MNALLLQLKRFPASWLFYALWGVIIAISVHDGMLVLVHRWTIAEDERNPVGRYLLELGGGDIWLLLVVKGAGTILAGAALLVIFWTRPRIGWAACLALAMVQSLLLLVLTFA